MNKVNLSKNVELIQDDDGTYYLRDTNTHTGSISVSAGTEEGDFIVFKFRSRSYMSIKKAEMKIYFM